MTEQENVMDTTNSFKRSFAVMLITALILGCFTVISAPAVSAASSCRIGQACCDERGEIYGGRAGDQTGREVAISNWSYSNSSGASDHWVYVFRAKDPAVARQLAASMIAACNNDHIGYDLSNDDRETLYREARKKNWNIAAITTDCETTCVDLVSVCLNSAGINAPDVWASVLVYDFLMRTGKFNVYTTSAFTSSPSKLEPGDILCNPNAPHTAMVVESANAPGTGAGSTVGTIVSDVTNAIAGSNPFRAGKDYQLTTALNVRSGPGTNFAVKTNAEVTREARNYSIGKTRAVLNKGTVVTCIRTSGNWIEIPSGWVCGKEGQTLYLMEYTGTAEQNELYRKAVTSGSSSSSAAAGTSTPQTAPAASASSGSKLVLQKYKDYRLKDYMNVRSGPGTSYRIKKRSELTKSGKENALLCSNGILKKGTIVTCLEYKGNWMRIPSGWICCNPEYVENYNG